MQSRAQAKLRRRAHNRQKHHYRRLAQPPQPDNSAMWANLFFNPKGPLQS